MKENNGFFVHAKYDAGTKIRELFETHSQFANYQVFISIL